MPEERETSVTAAGSRVLVTGCDGFVGRHVCRHLAGSGWSVRGARRSGPSEVTDGVECVSTGDIAARPDWAPFLEEVAVVVHAAGKAHARAGPDLCRRVNVEATAHLARCAAAQGVARFIHLSSMQVEAADTSRRAPAGPYALSKREAEAALAGIGAETGMEVVILRPPLVYGPGVGANFGLLLRAVRNRWPLPLASVDNRRSFIFVGNLADAVAAAAAHPGRFEGTFAVSDGRSVSVPDLLRQAAAATGCAARLLPCPVGFLRMLALAVGQRERAESLLGSLVADDRPFREAAGWSPPFTLAEGLAVTLAGR